MHNLTLTLTLALTQILTLTPNPNITLLLNLTLTLTVPLILNFNHTILTFIFLNSDILGHLAAERFSSSTDRAVPEATKKDPLTGIWRGSEPLILWGHVCVCAFPRSAEAPRYIPECLVRHHKYRSSSRQAQRALPPPHGDHQPPGQEHQLSANTILVAATKPEDLGCWNG